MSIRTAGGLLLMIFSCLAGCASQPQLSDRVSPRTQSSPPAASRHDLSADERFGGHTLQRHVGRTPQQLAERLQAERNIPAASSYNDRATAEAAVGQAIADSRPRITRWLNSPGGHPNLVLDYNAGHPIGNFIRRGGSAPEDCAHSIVVLKWTGGDYFVLTSYPECR